MKCFVTGGAGFVGSNLVDRLLLRGDHVVIYDNMSTGQREFISAALKNSQCKLIEGDILDIEKLKKGVEGCDIVFHFAANADVRFGTDHPEKDLQQNTIGTFNVLEAMRSKNVRKIVFSSTGSVYGEAITIPTSETAEFPVQTSLYAASKLAGEGLITSYCEGFGFQSWIFRFVSVLGERYTHGHVFDFYKKLELDRSRLEVLGNGTQRKSYLYVQDCIDGIFLAMERSREKTNIFNLGTNEYVKVSDSIAIITGHLGLTPELIYSDSDRGWIGDNPFIFLDCSKINNLGWQPLYGIKESILKTVDYIRGNSWILNKRS